MNPTTESTTSDQNTPSQNAASQPTTASPAGTAPQNSSAEGANASRETSPMDATTQDLLLQSVLAQFSAMQGFQPSSNAPQAFSQSVPQAASQSTLQPASQPAQPAFHLPRPLILASHSPRRRQLLTELGIPFECVPADESVETAFDPASFDSPADFVEKQSLFKALNVAEKFAGQDVWILACDTVAVCEDEILGKPTDRADARRMLRKLSGSLHEVLSGICLMNPAQDEKTRLDVVTTTLQMETLSDETLAAYLDSQKWRGKAGAFGYQDGNDWLQILHGSASNVVGLPTEKLLEWLAEL